MRVVPLVYHNLGCIGIDALVRHGFDIPVVITHRDSPNENIWFQSAAALSKSYGLAVRYSEDLDDGQLFDLVKRANPDVVLSIYFRRIVRQELIDVPEYGAVNIHGSLLPKYRGRVPVNWQLIYGEVESGVTLHFMVAKPDAGDIIAQSRVPVDINDTARTLYEKLQTATISMLDQQLPRIRDWTVQSVPQDESKATVFRSRKPEDGIIDWGMYSTVIHNLVRAVTKPYPGAFSDIESTRIILWKVAIDRPLGAGSFLPGRILVDNGNVFVKTGDGWIRVIEAAVQSDSGHISDIEPENILGYGLCFNTIKQVTH